MHDLQSRTERPRADGLVFKILICFLFSVACLFLDASSVVIGGPYYLPIPYFYTLLFVGCFLNSQMRQGRQSGAVNFHTTINVGLFVGLSGYILFDCARGGATCPAQTKGMVFDIVVYRTFLIAFLGHLAAIVLLRLALYLTDRWTKPEAY
ncbi:MAG: hypothetical protein CMK09_10350 [Ponticaulis sp.]|nr:hypothetical protein [Ponticaulis sp.]